MTTEAKRRAFERWMRRYWGGISLAKLATIDERFEYQEAAAQTAWEVWRKFSGRKK